MESGDVRGNAGGCQYWTHPFFLFRVWKRFYKGSAPDLLLTKPDWTASPATPWL